MNRISWICLIGLIGLLVIVGTLTIHSGVLVVAEEGTSSQQEEAQWQIGRKPCPKVRLAEQCALIAGNTEFAFDLFQTLWNSEDNLFFSPYSISLCLVMVYGGARGTTEEQMASALHFMLSQERLHIAFNALDLELARRGERLAVTEDEKFQLHLANSLWVASEYKLLESYRKLLVVNYGAAAELLDFANAPEASRQTINEWVSQETEKKIRKVLPEGVNHILDAACTRQRDHFQRNLETQIQRGLHPQQPFPLARWGASYRAHDGTDHAVSLHQNQRGPSSRTAVCR
jgi:hypothetical protein